MALPILRHARTSPNVVLRRNWIHVLVLRLIPFHEIILTYHARRTTFQHHLIPQLAFSMAQYNTTTRSFSAPPITTMISPSQPFNPQGNCLMFQKLPAELLDEIYAMVFTVETSEDGSIELNGATKPPSKALTMTCQKVRNETRAMYKAAYQSFPNHTFTVDMSIRTVKPAISPALGNDILLRINSYRITWSNEHKKVGRLHYTTHMDRDAPRQKFRTWVTRRSGDDDGDVDSKASFAAAIVIRDYADIASTAIEKFNGLSPYGGSVNGVLSCTIQHAVWDPDWERTFGYCEEKSRGNSS
jgi:hypothetical protein